MADLRIDPFPGYNFRVEIEGIDVAGFRSLTGLEMESESRDYRAGDDPEPFMRHQRGITNSSPLVLSRGLDPNGELFAWFSRVQSNGSVLERRTITIVQRNESGDDELEFRVFEAWPSKYRGPEYDAAGSENAEVEVEIRYTNFERQD